MGKIKEFVGKIMCHFFGHTTYVEHVGVKERMVGGKKKKKT